MLAQTFFVIIEKNCRNKNLSFKSQIVNISSILKVFLAQVDASSSLKHEISGSGTRLNRIHFGSFVADLYLVSGALFESLTLGSGMGKNHVPDPGSGSVKNIPDYISES